MDAEFLLVLISFVLTMVFAILVYGLLKDLSLGIFSRFFKILIAAALVSIGGRGAALLNLSSRVPFLPVSLETVSGLLFLVLLTAAFWQLLRDWRKLSLNKPLKRVGRDEARN
ncbi:MAG: hypothetical protein QXX19_02665 [Candidatus Caldarchaeum sp.]